MAIVAYARNLNGKYAAFQICELEIALFVTCIILYRDKTAMTAC